MRGKILKALAGFYYVIPLGEALDTASVDTKAYACRARGIFRKHGIKPLVGDEVEFDITHEGDMEGNVTAILPRKNELVRPKVANVDLGLLVFAMHSPEPSTELIDRFIINYCVRNIPVILNFNKSDLGIAEERSYYSRLYSGSGVEVHFTSTIDHGGVDELKEMLHGHTVAVAGPSGVGKSSLINSLMGEERMETGALSEKIKRGKQTTRHIEILPIAENTFAIDTPGFSVLDISVECLKKLEQYFPEIGRHSGECYFSGCSHISEPGCSVKEALKEGRIPKERYLSYTMVYEELSAAKTAAEKR